MNSVRIITSTRTVVNPKGLIQIINEFKTKTGLGTEIITQLDKQGNNGIRTIERDALGVPQQVTDLVYGRVERYQRAYPERANGVFQFSADNIRTYFPNISFDSLCKY